jgi:hypothetical protein
VTRDGASAPGVAFGGTGMDCWIVIGGGNYKISSPGPIRLRRTKGFSTLSTAWISCQSSAGAQQPSIDLSRARS